MFFFRHVDLGIEYILLQPADLKCEQGVGGGVEADETPVMAALREATEETGSTWAQLVPLDSPATGRDRAPIEKVTPIGAQIAAFV